MSAAILLLALVTFITVNAAPTSPLDATALLKNGQEAQKLNVAFQTIKETDPCTGDEKACMSGAVAACRNGTWAVAQGTCSRTQDCFALPSVREVGTLVTCTSEKNALSAIKATGATGGIFGDSSTQVGGDETSPSSKSSSNSTCQDGATGAGARDAACPAPTSSDSEDADSTSVPSATSDDSTSIPTSAPSPTSKPVQPTVVPSTETLPDVVTVTVTLDEPTALPPVTRTLSPQEASSVLSDLMANGATIIVSPPTSTVDSTSPSLTAAVVPTLNPSSPVVPSDEPSPTMSPIATPNISSAASVATQSTISSESGGY